MMMGSNLLRPKNLLRSKFSCMQWFRIIHKCYCKRFYKCIVSYYRKELTTTTKPTQSAKVKGANPVKAPQPAKAKEVTGSKTALVTKGKPSVPNKTSQVTKGKPSDPKILFRQLKLNPLLRVQVSDCISFCNSCGHAGQNV